MTNEVKTRDAEKFYPIVERKVNRLVLRAFLWHILCSLILAVVDCFLTFLTSVFFSQYLFVLTGSSYSKFLFYMSLSHKQCVILCKDFYNKNK